MTDMAAGKKSPEEKKPDTSGTGQLLRDNAEEQLAHSPKTSPDLTGQSPEHLIHELQVHQIELETQEEELKRAYMSLEESRDKYLDLYDFAPLGYLTISEDGLITDVNLTGAKLLGVERSSLIRARFSKCVTEKDVDEWHWYFMNVLNQMEKRTCTLLLKRGDRSRFPAHLEGIRITGSDGVTKVRIAIIDVTDRRKMEITLQVRDTQLQATLESTADGILAVDNKGKVLQANRRFAEIWKIPPSIMECSDDQILLDFVLGQLNDPEAFLKKVQLLYRSDDMDMDIITLKDDRVFERYSSPMIMEGSSIGRVWSYHDITERKRAEMALQQANKKLTTLSTITRHDINNQLSVILGYMDMLECKEHDPALTANFRIVSTAAQRIASMIQFTKEYENIGINPPGWQDCFTLVDTASKQVQLGKIKVKNDLAAGTEVFADPLIVKVCYNLMDNAVRYGEKITTIRFSFEVHNDYHVMVCEDDGVGIPVNEKDKIFERGFGKNYGVGLPLSREILSITGITITETSEPGSGARFEMAVPNNMYRLIDVK